MSSSFPLPRLAWPYVITATWNDHFTIGFADNANPPNPVGSLVDGDLTAGTYATPEILASRLQQDLTSHLTAGYSVQVVVDPLGRFNLIFTVPNGSGIAWVAMNPLASTSEPLLRCQALLGFTAQPFPGAVFNNIGTLTGGQAQNLWIASNPVLSDSRPILTYARSAVESLNSAKLVDWGSIERREVQLNYEPGSKVFIGQEGAQYANQALERFFASGTGGAGYFTYSPDAANPAADPYTDDGLAHVYCLQEETARQFKPERWAPGVPQFKVLLKMTRTQ